MEGKSPSQMVVLYVYLPSVRAAQILSLKTLHDQVMTNLQKNATEIERFLKKYEK